MIGLVDTGAAPLRPLLGPDTYDDVPARPPARPAEPDTHRDAASPAAGGER